MPRYCPRCGEALHTHSTTTGEVRKTARRAYESSPSPKPKRKASAYSKRYGAAFRKVASRFKKKNGSWKTNGFKNAQKAAHKEAKR
jgi:DNA-directed RNA polymerase subunit M/transcription elongation factor TFIIS